MSDYIKREEAVDAVMCTEPVVFDQETLEQYQKTKDVLKQLEQIPHTDVAKVTYCKDCEYGRACDQYIDIWGKHYHLQFCSCGEPKGTRTKEKAMTKKEK